MLIRVLLYSYSYATHASCLFPPHVRYDARLEHAGWDMPGFALTASWQPAQVCVLAKTTQARNNT